MCLDLTHWHSLVRIYGLFLLFYLFLSIPVISDAICCALVNVPHEVIPVPAQQSSKS